MIEEKIYVREIGSKKKLDLDNPVFSSYIKKEDADSINNQLKNLEGVNKSQIMLGNIKNSTKRTEK